METIQAFKQETIIDAALQRFSHYGIHKTTLSEIAGDLNISKPLLFYYFNDKESLVIAVMERLIRDFLESWEIKLREASTAEEGVQMFIETKREFFKKNLHLALQADGVQINRASPTVLKVILRTQKVSVNRLSHLFSEGVKKKELHPMDTTAVARLLLETFQSIELSFKNKIAIPSEKDIDELAEKQKKLTALLFSGLKICTA